MCGTEGGGVRGANVQRAPSIVWLPWVDYRTVVADVPRFVQNSTPPLAIGTVVSHTCISMLGTFAYRPVGEGMRRALTLYYPHWRVHRIVPWTVPIAPAAPPPHPTPFAHSSCHYRFEGCTPYSRYIHQGKSPSTGKSCSEQ